jgi:tRNA-guanine family transglycosylase
MNTFHGHRLIHTPVTTSPNDIKTLYPPDSSTGKELSWWSHNAFFPYSAMLTSAAYGMDSIKDRHEIRDDVLFLGDSGGFQVLQNLLDPTKNIKVCAKLTPESVIKWQLSVCDIGMTLDIPTPRAWIQIDNKKIFEDRLKQSKRNALEMLDFKEKHIDEYNPNFKLFNCIHGVYLKDMEEWYRETTDNHNCEFDGFSFSTSKIMKYLIALRLGFAMEHSKNQPFHLLGVSSLSSQALIAYANKYINTQIYFDSTAAATGKLLRKFMFLYNLTADGVSFKEKNKKYKQYYSLACPCPVCKNLARPEDSWELGTTSGILLTLHNLYWTTNYSEFISGLVHYDDEFKTYVKSLLRDSEPADNPYTPPKNIYIYIVGAASEIGDEYNYKHNKIYNIYNDLNLQESVKNGTIPLTAPLISKAEYLREKQNMSNINGSSYVLQYIDFLDTVHECGLETAWQKHFVKIKSNDDIEFKESNTKDETDSLRLLCAEENSRIQKLKREAENRSDYACRDAIKREIFDIKVREERKVAEIVDDALSEFSTSKKE